MASILDDVKKALGVPQSVTQFDIDIIMHINSEFSVLHQVGIGPIQGFAIEDSATLWGSFLSDNLTLNFVKSYVVIAVRLVFDPPQSSFTVESMTKKRDEYLWRINVARENALITGATPEMEFVFDGGAP